MQTAGRRVKHQMKLLRHRANTLQRSPQQGGKISAQARLVQSSALEGSFVVPGQNPGLVRHARCIRADRQVIATSLDNALCLPLLLLNDVAENAALLANEVLASCAEFVENSTRNEHRRGDLRSRMAEILAGILAVIFEKAYVLDAGIAFEIENALGGEA